MAGELQGKRIAIVVTDGFEESELTEPKRALESAGARAEIVAPKEGSVRAWTEKNWGKDYPVDQTLRSAKPEEYDALVLPGGVINPDKLRINQDAISFIRHFVEEGKPIGAICHGPWTLINAEGVEGRRVTSWGSLRKDLENAGAEWVDETVVVDQGLVTSRNPSDIPNFNKKLIEEIREGAHPGRERERPRPAL